MSRTRYTLAFDHHNMVPAPASNANYQVIWRTENGILIGYSTLSLAGLDAITDQFAPGCLMYDSTNNRWYMNQGTMASPDFQYITTFTDA